MFILHNIGYDCTEWNKPSSTYSPEQNVVNDLE